MKMTNWSLSKINTGYKPTAVPVAIDALAVLVNKDNPLKADYSQVDAIFSSTRKCGHESDIETGVTQASLSGAQKAYSYTDVTRFQALTLFQRTRVM